MTENTAEEKGGLFLTLRDGDRVRVGPDIEFHVREFLKTQVSVRISAPKSLEITHEETKARDLYFCHRHRAHWLGDISPHKKYETGPAEPGRQCFWCKKPVEAVFHIHLAPGVRGGAARG